MIVALLLQAAQPPALPDIELNLGVRAREVTIERKGEAKLEVRGAADASRVEVRVEPKAQGSARLRNVSVKVRAQASIEAEPKIDASAETGSPQ
jgi:hypothetical protein